MRAVRRRGRRSGRAAICATSRTGRSPRPTWTLPLRGRQARTVVAELATLGLCRRHRPRAACRARAGLAGRGTRRSLGGDGRPWWSTRPPGRREVAFFDAGQAVLSMMIAAADLGIGSGHGAVADQELARRVLAYRKTAFARTSSHLATRPSARSFRCDSPIGGRSATSSTAAGQLLRLARHALSRRPPRRSASRPSSSAAPAPREPLSPSRPTSALPGQ